MTIDYGDRARLGVMVPSGNAVAEPELRAMLPPGIGLLVTRLALTGSSEAQLLGMLDGLENAARLLADAKVDRLAFHCTAVSTFAPHLAGEIRARIDDAAAIPSLATADAILAALAALRARRVLLVTPYVAPVHQREVDYLQAHGFEVLDGGCLGAATNDEMGRIPPDAIAEQARQAMRANPGADVCFISCTAIRSAGLIADLEAEIGIPVITSNQVLAWHALRMMGVPDTVSGFGRLMALPAA